MTTPTHGDHLVNFELVKMAQEARRQMGGFGKTAFVPASDPGMGAGGDPSQGGGGAPPPGADPSGGGGAPPPAPAPDPSAGGGGGGGGLDAILQAIQQLQMTMQQGGGANGGAGGAAGGLKPKIDVNVEIMQVKNLLAKICDHLGIQVPAQDMVATPEKLTAMAQGQSVATPAAGGAAGGGADQGAIGGMQPMDPMQGAGMPGAGGAPKTGSYRANGTAFDATGIPRLGHGNTPVFDSSSFAAVGDRAAALTIWRRAKQSA